MAEFEKCVQEALKIKGLSMQDAPVKEMYSAISKAAVQALQNNWQNPAEGKTACYFSAEFLLGRLIYSNLYNLKLLDEVKNMLVKAGRSPAMFEEIEDAALGNGGLGRLAACFLDSAATEGLRLNGYGIRYQYGLFKQRFEEGFQKEEADGWLDFGDPWSVRNEEDRVKVDFGDQSVWAVPYDMPVPGYGNDVVNNLRLWQAEPVHSFNFELFNQRKYSEAYGEQSDAQAIHSVLYPNDDDDVGKCLRLKQQYFFASASLQSILKDFVIKHGENFEELSSCYAVQLNDTHPSVAIPELLRLLMQTGMMTFDKAQKIAFEVFAYTNHTIMPEALETWSVQMFATVLPEVYPYVVMLNEAMRRELAIKEIKDTVFNEDYAIIANGRVHMARMAVYACHSTNGVAALHTEILTSQVMKNWYKLYPSRFNNKTNGVTQRRWLALCNPELAKMITAHIGDGWIKNLDELEKLKDFADDKKSLTVFAAVKASKKRELAAYIKKTEGIKIDINSVFDVQVKRLHEYKRQLLNAFSILDLYFQIKEGKLQDLPAVTFIFGAKAAPGYARAKAIIKFINEIGKLIESDPVVKDKLRVVFVQNYNVSYAEKIIPAADISEQISTVGTEASGTGNMKLMMNGAVTLGTLDGANVEIVWQTGRGVNFMFGTTPEEMALVADEYSPRELYAANPRVRRVVKTLIDGTVDDGGTGMFEEIYRSLMWGASWHKPDHYYLMLDFEAYTDTKIRVLKEYKNREAFNRRCFMNIASAGQFSSDRTVREYASDIWGLK